jgi:hypothetical protein
MAQIQINQPTSLPANQVQARINRLIAYLSREIGLKTVWKNNIAYVQGTYKIVAINAAIVIQPSGVMVVAEDPGMLFRSKAEAYLKEQLATYLNPAVPIERLPA